MSPKSLQDLCIDLVAKKMNIWCKHSLSELYHFGPEEGTNPFDCLCKLVVILDDIVCSLFISMLFL